MLNLNLEVVNSISSFAQYCDPWNQLWINSNAYEPMSRSEGIQRWHQQFSAQDEFSAIMVWNGAQLVGGLPLIHSQKYGVKLLQQPRNDWCNAGELMVHSAVEVQPVVAAIVQGLATFSESVLCFDGVRFETEPWTTFIKEVEAVSGQMGILRREKVGLIEVGDDWDAYFQSLSGNHRSSVRRAEKKARKSAELSLLRLQDLSNDDRVTWMNRAFEIENRSWKRDAGTSILASEGMSSFFLDEAEIARTSGMLELWFLMLDQEPIAFEYCHLAKQVLLSYKIGFDESFKHLAPGKLLRKLQLETLCRQSPGTVLDTKGILCSEKAKWATSTYDIGRLVVALKGRIPKLVLSAYLHAKPIVQRFRNVESHSPSLGSAGAN